MYGGRKFSGTGVFTGRHVSINYSPPDAANVPALSVSFSPPSDVEIPLLDLISQAYHLGPVVNLDRIEEGNFLLASYEGVQKSALNQDGSFDTEGYIYAKWANAGGVSAVADGTTDVDMTLGNIFTCTPDEATVFTTTSPTNGKGGQIALFCIDNTAGVTVSWSTGFTDVTAIGAGDTGIQHRLMHFNGTTWHGVETGGGGALPAGTINQSLRHDGADWTANDYWKIFVDHVLASHGIGGGVVVVPDGTQTVAMKNGFIFTCSLNEATVLSASDGFAGQVACFQFYNSDTVFHTVTFDSGGNFDGSIVKVPAGKYKSVWVESADGITYRVVNYKRGYRTHY